MTVKNSETSLDSTGLAELENLSIYGHINSVAQLFADKNDIPQWAEEGVSKLYSTGVVSGYEDNTILPNNNMKRAEAATMLYKIENK